MIKCNVTFLDTDKLLIMLHKLTYNKLVSKVEATVIKGADKILAVLQNTEL